MDPRKADIQINIPREAFLPCYRPLVDDQTADIDFIWGGRDSGKSYFVAQLLIILCLSLPYFRCILVRKIFNTIKDSQWQTIKDIVEEWGIDHLFDFSTSPLEIRCVNGNKFICRGMDEPGRVKSLANPSHCWIEEGNQITQRDFITTLTSLRFNKGRVKTFFTFNPESETDYKEFWLYALFFKEYDEQHVYNFTAYWSIKRNEINEVDEDKAKGRAVEVIKYVYRSTHTTYHDNSFCAEERKILNEQLKIIDPYYYRVYTLGLWGNRKIEDPFCFAFDYKKHVKPTTLNRRLEVKLSFDFNVNPITCGVYQDWEDQQGLHIRVVEAIQLEQSDIYKLLDRINEDYTTLGVVYLVTGDATGRNTTALVQDNINYYTVIKQKLNLSVHQIKTPSVNPKVKENRLLVNAVLAIVDILFDPVNCKNLIFDCQNVSVNEVGDIEKGDRKNPKRRADHLDHMRYYFNTFHKKVLTL